MNREKKVKAERKNPITGELSAFLFPEKVCDKDSESRCVMCGATVPEGRQVCPTCQANAISKSFKAALI